MQAVATPVTPNGQNISSSGEPNANQVEEEEEEEDGALVVGVRKSNVVLQVGSLPPIFLFNLMRIAGSYFGRFSATISTSELASFSQNFLSF